MQARLIFFVMLLLSSCSLKRLLPKGPVLKAKERQSILKSPKKQTIAYEGAPKLDFPVLPIQVWAATYDLDIVLVSNHPLWNMHELARIQTPEGSLWIMKDALDSTLEQSIIANIPEVHSWLPEIAVPRKYYPVKVEDNSTEDWLNLDFKYENRAGELCEVHYEGKFPIKKQPKRNGSTMGHSKKQLIAVLDLPVRDFGKKASISFDGQPYKIKKILGLVPFKMALQQTQAGLSIASLTMQQTAPDSLRSRHLHLQQPVEQDWRWQRTDSGSTLIQQNPLRTIRYEFNGQDTLELVRATVQAWNAEQPDFQIHFSPALPDLRRPFRGVVSCRFIMDVGGQKSHAEGMALAEWVAGTVELTILPTDPWWVAERPMLSRIQFEGDSARIEIERISAD